MIIRVGKDVVFNLDNVFYIHRKEKTITIQSISMNSIDVEVSTKEIADMEFERIKNLIMTDEQP
jgi:hypothetical protein